jgi:hypothetical protein
VSKNAKRLKMIMDELSFCAMNQKKRQTAKAVRFFFLFFVGFMPTLPHEVVGVSALAHL